MKKHELRYHLAKRVTLISFLINMVLGVLKIVIGFVGHSAALIADGVHSMSDLLTDVMVIFAAKAGSQGPDEDHPYGHGRIETLFVILLSAFLILVGLGILADAGLVIWKKKYTDVPDVMVLIMAAVSIIANEFLFRIIKRVGLKIRSNLLLANAWHHRGDAYSSGIVLIGAAGAMAGVYFLDALAAMVVAVLIIKMGVTMAWQSVRELVDTGMPAQLTQDIRRLIANTHGVEAVHQLRSRSIAGRYFLDVHVQVSATLSVSEGHYIAERVHQRVLDAFIEIKDITIHVDPEDDELGQSCLDLPDRYVLLKTLKARWQDLPGYEKILSIRLDYLSGKIYIQAFLPLAMFDAIDEGISLQAKYRQALAGLDYIAEVVLNFQSIEAVSSL